MEQARNKNKEKLNRVVEKVESNLDQQSSPLITQGLCSTLISLQELSKSCSRYENELKGLKRAKEASEDLYVYLSTETYLPVMHGHSEYEKIKSEIRKLKGQILSCRNFPSLR